MSNQISTIIESICQQGCSTVNSVIKALEMGETISNVQHLTAAERIQVIKELKEIMSVYERK